MLGSLIHFLGFAVVVTASYFGAISTNVLDGLIREVELDNHRAELKVLGTHGQLIISKDIADGKATVTCSKICIAYFEGVNGTYEYINLDNDTPSETSIGHAEKVHFIFGDADNDQASLKGILSDYRASGYSVKRPIYAVSLLNDSPYFGAITTNTLDTLTREETRDGRKTSLTVFNNSGKLVIEKIARKKGRVSVLIQCGQHCIATVARKDETSMTTFSDVSGNARMMIRMKLIKSISFIFGDPSTSQSSLNKVMLAQLESHPNNRYPIFSISLQGDQEEEDKTEEEDVSESKEQSGRNMTIGNELKRKRGQMGPDGEGSEEESEETGTRTNRHPSKKARRSDDSTDGADTSPTHPRNTNYDDEEAEEKS